MNSARSRYHGHRFPPEIIGYAVWVYHRFCLSFRDVEDLLAERGIIVSYEAIRQWCSKFGPTMPDVLRRNRDASVIPGIWTNSLSESTASSSIFGGPWIRMVMSSIFCCSLAAIRVQPSVLRRLLRGQGKQPFRIITDKLKSYAAAGRTILPGVTHDTQQSGRDFASAHSDERTTNAPIQITPTSSALSITPRCRPESILRCATFAEIDSSPTLQVSVLRGLANGNGGLTISNSRL